MENRWSDNLQLLMEVSLVLIMNWTDKSQPVGAVGKCIRVCVCVCGVTCLNRNKQAFPPSALVCLKALNRAGVCVWIFRHSCV